ncbi:MAG TPA: nitric-oxide reductase large subunit, partial [Prolixibacteraceae bacterium]|nr:nitric-oxide reductase large subunit [Prolixibacteraceae bacterium]
MKTKKLWIGFAAVVAVSFAVLLFFGVEIYRKAPPIPERVVTASGELLFSGADIRDGQNVWQSMGGQEVGTVWGHGAYQAPDWTADWLHREAVFMLDHWAVLEAGKPFDQLGEEQQAALKARLQKELRTNTYDAASGTITISDLRAEAFRTLSLHYKGLFTNDPAKDHLREAYSIATNAIKDEVRMSKMNAFFFWATWATVTERPGQSVTYTHNWPPEELVGNKPTGSLILWTGFSVILLLAGIGWLSWYYASSREEELQVIPEVNPVSGLQLFPSMKATLKYFWVVMLM